MGLREPYGHRTIGNVAAPRVARWDAGRCRIDIDGYARELGVGRPGVQEHREAFHDLVGALKARHRDHVVNPVACARAMKRSNEIEREGTFLRRGRRAHGLAWVGQSMS